MTSFRMGFLMAQNRSALAELRRYRRRLAELQARLDETCARDRAKGDAIMVLSRHWSQLETDLMNIAEGSSLDAAGGGGGGASSSSSRRTSRSLPPPTQLRARAVTTDGEPGGSGDGLADANHEEMVTGAVGAAGSSDRRAAVAALVASAATVRLDVVFDDRSDEDGDDADADADAYVPPRCHYTRRIFDSDSSL